jgi:hypothetical protein
MQAHLAQEPKSQQHNPSPTDDDGDAFEQASR